MHARSPATGPSLLLSPTRLGAIELRNRVVMAPLTRQRSLQPGNRPHTLMATYYGQRASAGLIIAEGAQIEPRAQGFAWTPGIHSAEQVAGWKQVTDAVHQRGGRIVLQLWHAGRISHRSFQPQGQAPLGPSAVKADARCFVETGQPGEGRLVACDTPQAMTVGDINDVIHSYARAAGQAMEAGFDGVEIQAGNGFLPDQFLGSNSNQRTDAYGLSVDGRCRFLLEVLDAVIAAIGGPDRAGLHLSPLGTMNDIEHAMPELLFPALLEAVARRQPAYLHLSGSSAEARNLIRKLRAGYPGAVIRAGGYDAASAEQDLRAGAIDAAVFGKPFIANPDLVERIRSGADWSVADERSFYGGGAEGYTTYPNREGA